MQFPYWIDIGGSIGNQGQPILFKDQSGNAVFPKALTSGILQTTGKTFLDSIKSSEISSYETFFKYIEVSSVRGENILMIEEEVNEQSLGGQRSIVSTSSNDNVVGIGAKVIGIDYLNSSTGSKFTEYVELTGITPKNTIATDIKYIQNMWVVDAGTSEVAQGKIKLMSQTEGNGEQITAIPINQTQQQSSYTYARGSKSLYIKKMIFSVEEESHIDIYTTQKSGGYTIISKTISLIIAKNNTPFILNTMMIIPPNGKLYIKYSTNLSSKKICVIMEGWIN